MSWWLCLGIGGPLRVAQLLGLAAGRLIWGHGCTHSLVGVDPRAAMSYEAVWGFVPCSNSRTHHDLKAPVMALVGSRAVQRSHIRKHMGVHRLSGRTFEDLMFGAEPAPGMELGLANVSGGERPRMSRETFQSLFLERTDHLQEVSPETLAHARRHRSDRTLGIEEKKVGSQDWRVDLPGGYSLLDRGADRPEESGLIWMM